MGNFVSRPAFVHQNLFTDSLLLKSPEETFVIERVKKKEAEQPDLSLPRPPLVDRGEGPLAVRHTSLDTADANK